MIVPTMCDVLHMYVVGDDRPSLALIATKQLLANCICVTGMA